MKVVRILILLAALPSALAAAPMYQLIDLGPANDNSLQWANPPACDTTAYGASPVLTCAASRTLAVGAIKLAGPIIQHAAVTSLNNLDLGALPGSVFSTAHGVNNKNLIVGVNGPVYPQPTNSMFAVYWTLTGNTPNGPYDLGNFMHSPYFNASAWAVNDSGEIVGASDIVLTNGTTVTRAALWANGAIYELQYRLQGSPQVALSSALWINCEGDIAAIGFPLALPNAVHFYFLKRHGPPRNCPLD
jgi:uncharacterized membrane protein